MFVLMSSRICLKLGHLGSKTRSPGQILLKMFVLMSSRICSKLGHLVAKTRSPGQISRKLCYNHFELWSECLPWSVLDKALKVLCCSGERYRAIMALLFFFYLHDKVCCRLTLETKQQLIPIMMSLHNMRQCIEISNLYTPPLDLWWMWFLFLSSLVP